MKKTWIIFPLLILMITFFFLLLPKKEDLVKEKIKEYNTQISTILNQLKTETLIEEGIISGKLRYIGAHNEPYEVEILNDFYLKSIDNKITATLITEKNSLSILCESDFLGLMNAWKNTNNIDNILEIKEINKAKDEVQITLNQEKINETLQKNYQKTTATFQIKGIIPTIEKVEFQLDDTIILIENNIVNIQEPNQSFSITLQKDGYFLSDNNFKMQKERKDEKTTYHIVKNDAVLTITKTKDEIKLSTTTKKDQFHSMEITLKKEKLETVQKETGTLDQFPILKYIKALNIIDWRENYE